MGDFQEFTHRVFCSVLTMDSNSPYDAGGLAWMTSHAQKGTQQMANETKTQTRPDPDKDDRPRTVNVIVNGRPKAVHAHELSFQEVVKLAFDDPPTGDTVLFSVTYRNGPDQNPSGTMVEGQVVKIKHKMVFDVTATNKS